MGAFSVNEDAASSLPRVIIVGLTSCYGCQLQITNYERYLTDILSQFELSYWQLTSSRPLPSEYDIAIIEGAVTTEEARQLVKTIRSQATIVISLGSCATIGGIPGLAAQDYETHAPRVCGTLPAIGKNACLPRSVPEEISVDYEIPGCPIDIPEFLSVLNKALYGSNRSSSHQTMCGDCKRNETACFLEKKELCLGLVTLAGCRAACVNLGRPCQGCRGLSPEANLVSAREIMLRYEMNPEDIDHALELFNQVNPVSKKG